MCAIWPYAISQVCENGLGTLKCRLRLVLIVHAAHAIALPSLIGIMQIRFKNLLLALIW